MAAIDPSTTRSGSRSTCRAGALIRFLECTRSPHHGERRDQPEHPSHHGRPPVVCAGERAASIAPRELLGVRLEPVDQHDLAYTLAGLSVMSGSPTRQRVSARVEPGRLCP